MFALVYGEQEADWDATAAQIVALETKIAAAHWDVVKRRDADLTYNLRTFAELRSEATGFDWAGVAARVGRHPDEQAAEVVVRQPDALTAFAALWDSEDIEDWKRWLRWRVISGRASLLTDDLVDENFAFYGRTLSGTEQMRDRWKRGVALVESLMGDAVGKLYVERHFPPDAKARMDELVANLREAYRVSITDLEWMTPETRQRALEKLDKFTPKIGYPAKWRDYSTLVIARDDLYGNYQRGYALEYDRDLAKLGGPVDRDEWFMTPQTVNAYYNPGMNEIVFPAAILQPPFFDAEADDAANYGGIGAVIGHEIGHGFDDQGAKYDGDGNLVDWWTDDDRAEFGLRTKALIEQYEVLHAPRARDAGHHVNGAFTVGENIGDLGGLSIALLAYQLSLNGEERPRHRRPDRRAAGVLRLGAGVAHQIARRRGDPAAGHRPALAAGVPLQRRHPQHRRLLRRVRGHRGRRAVPGPATPGQDLELGPKAASRWSRRSCCRSRWSSSRRWGHRHRSWRRTTSRWSG